MNGNNDNNAMTEPTTIQPTLTPHALRRGKPPNFKPRNFRYGT